MNRQTATLDPIVRPSRRTHIDRHASSPPAGVTDIFEPAIPRHRAAPISHLPPNHQRIALIAYHIWEQQGRPHGDDLAHWFAAQAMLHAQQQASYPRPSA